MRKLTIRTLPPRFDFSFLTFVKHVFYCLPHLLRLVRCVLVTRLILFGNTITEKAIIIILYLHRQLCFDWPTAEDLQQFKVTEDLQLSKLNCQVIEAMNINDLLIFHSVSPILNCCKSV